MLCLHLIFINTRFVESGAIITSRGSFIAFDLPPLAFVASFPGVLSFLNLRFGNSRGVLHSASNVEPKIDVNVAKTIWSNGL